ncbi:MAG: hypothetical protein K0Q87_4699 [Neobacillus sp.]|nr:hypothetical protein [Neobacillus sp.]
MKALIVEPMKAPYEEEIPNTLAALQKTVGGTIQALYPYPDEVALICHDEGKLLGLPLNRRIEDYDIIAGTFCIVGLSEDNFKSLSPTLIQKYKEKFAALELYIPLCD